MHQPISVIRTLSFLGALTILSSADGADTKLVYSLQKIPAGTTVVDAKADRWNQLILLARPMLMSGDIDRISSGLKQSVSHFSYTVLATVSNSPPVPAADSRARSSSATDSNETSNPRSSSYRLMEVGIGYSAPVQGRQVIVTAAQDGGTADLGIIDRQVLSQTERDLETARVVVRSSTLMMFDLIAILARENGHREEQVRNLVWIDPQTGKSAIAMWVVEQRGEGGGPGESLTVRDDPMQVYPSGTRGINRLHVDASTFLLGIPTAKTFGLERLLRGRQIRWTSALRELASKSSYSSETLADFSAALSEAIRATRSGSAVPP
jgi:hypothetical protein